MGKHFWPLFIIVAAIGAAAVWTQTPRYVTCLPDGMRSAFRGLVRNVYDLPSNVKMPEKPDTAEPVLLGGGTVTVNPAQDSAPQATAQAQEPRPAAQSQEPKATVQIQKPAAAIQTQEPPSPGKGKVAITPQFAAPADIKGVKVVNVASAEWCVLMRSTPIEALDEKPLGTASGGRFFIIERRARATAGKTLIGNFTPKKLSQPVQINSRYALCLSGSPDELTTAQRHALKMYYQLRGEALDHLDEIRKTKGDSASPFHRKLLEAERIRDFRAKELSQMTSLSGEQKAVELSELEKLKAKAADIRTQHENWKRAHSAQIIDPTRDPHYQELVQEYRSYAKSLPAGLAVE